MRARLFVSFLFLLFCSHAFGQTIAYPTKVVRFIVPFPPGGINDTLARSIAQKLSASLGQQVIVENRPGAAGNIGADALAKATPDGYTIGILNGIHTVNAGFYRKLAYDITRDFTPVAAVGESSALLVAHPSIPLKTVREFVAYAKSNPGKLRFGSATTYTMDLLRAETGIEVTLVNYKGIAQVIQELIGGQIDIATGATADLLPHVKSGKLRVIAVTTLKRIPDLPDVPAIAETVPGYDAGQWYAVFAPAKTPQAIVDRLNREIAAALHAPEVSERLSTQAIDLRWAKTPPTEIAARVKQEVGRWSAVARKTGAYLD